jgi:hypothetical protein
MFGGTGAFVVEYLIDLNVIINRLIVSLLLTFVCQSAISEATKTDIPAPFTTQIQKLTDLLLDSSASSLATSRNVQKIDDIFLVTFVIEGYLSGNGWTQYIAAFEEVPGMNDRPTSYPLIDFIPIGGGGCRLIPELKAQLLKKDSLSERNFSLDVLEKAEDDTPNHPTKKASITIGLKNGRFIDNNLRCAGVW